MKWVPVVTSTRLPPGSYTYRNIPCATACLDGAASIGTSASRNRSAARKQLLARVDEPRQVVQAPVAAGVVGGVDQLVGGDREAHPGALLAAVVVDDLLVGAEAELLLGEPAVGGDVRRQHVDVVDPLDRGAAVDVALGHVLEPRAQVLGRHVAVLLVEELEPVAVGVAELERGAVPVVALVPADAEPRGFDRRDAPLQRLRAPGPERRCGRGRAARTRSASGRTAGTRPSRAGTPTDPRCARSPSRTARRRTAGSPQGTASAARRGRCGRGRGSAQRVKWPSRPFRGGRRGRTTARRPAAWRA